MIIAPKRSDRLIDKNGFPTARFAEWMERVSTALNEPGELSGLGTAAYRDVGVESGNVVEVT